MDRRYYGLKALLVALAVILAVVSSILGGSELNKTTIHVHYGAAAVVESAALRATAKFSRAVRDVIRRADCSIKHTFRS